MRRVVVGIFLVLCFTVSVVQAQPPQEVITRDTVRACELASITDNSTLEEVLVALEETFGPEGLGFLTFPPNPARALIKRIEVVRSPTCVVTEWEFYFLGDPNNPDDIPFEIIPFGLGDAQHDVTLYNSSCGCLP